MERKQFHVLCRQFLFRIVDLELLTAEGDTNQLLGRMVALLGFISMVLGMGAMLLDPKHIPADALLAIRWGAEHRSIATTMLATGLVAVLSWDAVYPDARDVLVLTPLPIRTGTMFLAKLAAAITVLMLTVFAINVFSGFSWPFILVPEPGGVLRGARTLLAYWATMLLSGGFVFTSVLGVQGVAAQVLPYRYLVRVSSLLQLLAFCLLTSVYLLQPSLSTPAAISSAESRGLLVWLPSYWFLGLFQALNGSAHQALSPSASRATAGLATVAFVAAAAFVLSYFRIVRKIVEEPAIAPGYAFARWSPRLKNSLVTAVVLFSVRALFRSRQHRVLLAFYLGIAFAIVAGYLRTPLALRELTPGTAADHLNVPAMVSSIVVLVAAIVGTRVVFGLPLALRANWIFRVTELHHPLAYLTAVRWSLFLIAALPVCLLSAALFLYVWPWKPVAGHIGLLLLLSLVLIELCLYEFRKAPFTFSYLPGKSNIQIAFGLSLMGLLAVTHGVARIERNALEDPVRYSMTSGVLVVALAAARWRTTLAVTAPTATLEFDDQPTPALSTLDLHRDGVPLA